MGRITAPVLELLDIPYELCDPQSLSAQLESLTATMRSTRRPVALVVPKGILDR
jgi:hypothetical protein